MEASCAALRITLSETTGLGRRELIRALTGTIGAALMGKLGATVNAAALPVTAFVFGGAWKKAAIKAFRRAIYGEDRNPDGISGPVHIPETARYA